MEKAKLAVRKWLGIVDCDHSALESRIEELEAELASFKDALRAKAAKSEPKEPLAPRQSKRYIPLATRRAQAERASQGPITHAEKVRENNIKAFEMA